MVFANNKSVSIAEFSINLTELIAPYYNLIIDIARQDNEEEIRNILERIFVPNILSCQDLEPEVLKDNCLLNVVSHLTDLLYETLDKLESSDILFLNFRRKLVIFNGDSSGPKKNLQKWLKDFNPLETMFNLLIRDERIRVYKEKICKLANEQTYSVTIKIWNVKEYEAAIIERNWLMDSDVVAQIIDNSDIWVNTKKLTQFNQDELQDPPVELNDIYLGTEYIGVEVGKYLIPVVGIENFIKPDFQKYYFWELLTHAFVTRSKGEISEHSESFKNVFKDGEFCQTLSHLKYNLYIEQKDYVMPDKYLEYFDEVYSLENLSHIPDFNLFTGVREDHSDKSLIGVYSKTKIGSLYNLLHWVIGKEGDNAHVFSGDQKGKPAQIIKAFALRPQYSYYYISKFFEEIFVDILKELDVPSMNNIELQYKGSTTTSIEIDVILQKNDGTVVVVENKTNLSKENIESTLHKFQKFHSYLTKGFPSIKIEYMLVAPYSNQSVKDGFYYFVKRSGNGEKSREGYNCKIYDFRIPFAQFDDLELRCLVEPDYSILKEKIQAIL